MSKFVAKGGGWSRVIYELDEERRTLRITTRWLFKVLERKSMDLRGTACSFFEILPGKGRIVPRILAWAAILLGVAAGGIGLYFQVRNAVCSTLGTGGLMVLSAIWIAAGLRYCKGDPKKGCFYFQTSKLEAGEGDGGDSSFLILYGHSNRSQAYDFACAVARSCGKTEADFCGPYRPLASHRFANGWAQLFDDRILLYNPFGVEICGARYVELQEEVEFIFRNFTIFNILFGGLAGIMFLASAAFAAAAASLLISSPFHGYAVGGAEFFSAFAAAAFAMAPFAIGYYVYGFCRRNEKFYCVDCKDEESEDEESEDVGAGSIIMEVGKDTADPGEFIKILERQLRAAQARG